MECKAAGWLPAGCLINPPPQLPTLPSGKTMKGWLNSTSKRLADTRCRPMRDKGWIALTRLRGNRFPRFRPVIMTVKMPATYLCFPPPHRLPHSDPYPLCHVFLRRDPGGQRRSLKVHEFQGPRGGVHLHNVIPGHSLWPSRFKPALSSGAGLSQPSPPPLTINPKCLSRSKSLNAAVRGLWRGWFNPPPILNQPLSPTHRFKPHPRLKQAPLPHPLIRKKNNQ